MANETVTPLPQDPLVDVVDPNGKQWTIPQSMVDKAVFQDKAFTLAPQSPFKLQDVGKDGRINAVAPNGSKVTLPNDPNILADALKPAGEGGGGFLLQSQHDREAEIAANPEIQKNMELFRKAQSFDTKANDELHKLHEHDDIFDENKRYKMIGPKGNALSVPYDQINHALASGYKFKDSNFQNAFDANIELAKQGQEGGGVGSIGQFSRAFLSTIPIVGTAVEGGLGKLNEVLPSSAIAGTLARHSEEYQALHPTATTAGTVVGIGSQLLAPEGLFGEAALAGKVGKAIKGAEALEQAPIIASIASNAAKGMLISAPQVADALINRDPKLAAESLAIGGIGGVIFGELPRLFNATTEKASIMAGERLPGAVDKGLASLGFNAQQATEESIMKMDQHAKSQLLDTLLEAGLKESSNAEGTMQALGKVAGGDAMKSLGKLDAVAEEKILTGHLSNELINVAGHGPAMVNAPPELEQAVTSLTQKMDKMFPEGTGKLQDVQKLVSELSEDIAKVKGASEVNNFKIQARDLIMNELFKAGDQAALNADAKTVAMWGQDKAMAQAASQMQGNFSSQLAQAGEVGAEKTTGGNILKDLALAATGHVPVVGHAAHVAAHALGVGRLPTFTDIAAEHVIPFAKNLFGKSDNAGIQNWIVKNADNPNISSYLTLSAIHNTHLNIGQIPEALRNPVIKSALFANNPDPLKSILGNEANGLSKSQQLDKLSNKISMLAGNDELRDKYLDGVTSMIAKNHPELAQSLKSELTNKIMATNKLLSGTSSTQPQAFQTPNKTPPSKDKMAEIQAGLNAIENPYSILAGLKDGKVSSKQVEIVKETHPAIYQEMVNQINKEAYSGKTPLSYQQRLSVSMITGQPMDQSLKIGAALQNTYAAAPPPAKRAAPKGSKGGHKTNAEKISGGYTAAQRLLK